MSITYALTPDGCFRSIEKLNSLPSSYYTVKPVTYNATFAWNPFVGWLQHQVLEVQIPNMPTWYLEDGWFYEGGIGQGGNSGWWFVR